MHGLDYTPEVNNWLATRTLKKLVISKPPLRNATTKGGLFIKYLRTVIIPNLCNDMINFVCSRCCTSSSSSLWVSRNQRNYCRLCSLNYYSFNLKDHMKAESYRSVSLYQQCESFLKNYCCLKYSHSSQCKQYEKHSRKIVLSFNIYWCVLSYWQDLTRRPNS